MGIISHQVVLGTAVSVVCNSDSMAQDVWIHNSESGANTYACVGDINVSLETGMHIHSGETHKYTLQPNDILYGVAGAGEPRLEVLQIKKGILPND